MSAQHNPGPWVAVESRVYFPNRAGGFDIRACPNAEANARLIAAAPELLEALRALLKEDEVLFDGTGSATMCKARAVIAKATGEQP